jgi:hypothetical protein
VHHILKVPFCGIRLATTSHCESNAGNDQCEVSQVYDF